MNHQSVSISTHRIDIWLRDTREFESLQPDGFRLDLSLCEGLGRFDLRPHCGIVPIYYGDAEGTSGWMGQKMDGAVTLVGEDSEVLDQVEFRLDSRTAGLLWSVLTIQEEMGWSREEVEERTWWIEGCEKAFVPFGIFELHESIVPLERKCENNHNPIDFKELYTAPRCTNQVYVLVKCPKNSKKGKD